MAREILRCAQNDRTWFHRNLELLNVDSFSENTPAGPRWMRRRLAGAMPVATGTWRRVSDETISNEER